MTILDEILLFIAKGLKMTANHWDTRVSQKESVHGMKLGNEGELQVLNHEGEWVDASIGGGVPPKNTTFTKTPFIDSNGLINFYFEDGEDSLKDGELLSKWKGTKIVRKRGDFPRNPKDGEVVGVNTRKNQFSSTPFRDRIPEKDREDIYYYGFFPFDDKGNYNCSVDNLKKIKHTPTFTLTATIDESVLDPQDAVTYHSDVLEKGLTPNSDLWMEYFGIKMVILDLTTGEIVGEVDKYDQRKFSNGETIPLTSDYRHMTFFPLRGYRITKTELGKVEISITNTFCPGYQYNAFSNDKIASSANTAKGLYLSTYMGLDGFIGEEKNTSTIDDMEDVLDSLHDRNLECEGWFQWTYIQILLTLYRKSLDFKSCSTSTIDDLAGNTASPKAEILGQYSKLYKHRGRKTFMTLGLEDPYGRVPQFLNTPLWIRSSESMMKFLPAAKEKEVPLYEFAHSYLKKISPYDSAPKFFKFVGGGERGFLPNGRQGEGSSSTGYCSSSHIYRMLGSELLDLEETVYSFIGGVREGGVLPGGFNITLFRGQRGLPVIDEQPCLVRAMYLSKEKLNTR